MKNRLTTGMIVTGALMLVGLVVVGCTTPAAAPTATSAPPPAATAPPAPELTGDPVRGGLLYDKWWAVPAMEGEEEHEAAGPTTDQPLWKAQTTNTLTGAGQGQVRRHLRRLPRPGWQADELWRRGGARVRRHGRC